ncbi:DUF2254 domain-containing protein [Stenotrophomonas sp. NPDC077659]|uniref:DUF2254 domain-containing protein n=1 Tax=Stenotrophomonas sp. NPDC077659 TaxID=3390694 RepID=UPI003D01A1B7
MLTRWKLKLSHVTRRMWFRSTLYGAMGVVTALAGAFLKFLIPTGLATRIGADSVGNILGILAASMLTVTTFSLSTMVSAYGSASTSATPRAARLLIEDSRAQGALATFIGAFLFSIVGLIALSTGLYGDSGRLVLFGATVGVIVVITVTLLRAIEQFSRFGRLGETIDLVERATQAAMKRRAADPLLGGAPPRPVAAPAVPLVDERIAYVEHIDMARLETLASEHALRIHLRCQIGTFATPARPVMEVEGTVSDETRSQLLAALSCSDTRAIDNDPRYGLVILSEIGQRAMSASINDPGTCIDVIGTCVRLLHAWAGYGLDACPAEVRYPHVHMAPLQASDLLDDVFTPISRDAAGSLEVNIRLQKGFAALLLAPDPAIAEEARRHAQWSLARAWDTLTFGPDREALRAAASVPLPFDPTRPT